MKKLAIVVFVFLFAIGFSACSQEEESGEPFELGGIGIDDIVSLEIPEGYEEADITQNGPGSGEILSRSWANEDSSVRIVMLSCGGKGILGADGDIDNYIDSDNDVVSIGNPPTDAYVTYVDGTSEEGEAIKNNNIEATFGYDKYVLGLEMENTQEEPITDEQKETFYTILKSITLKEL